MEASLKGACGGELSITGAIGHLGHLRSDLYLSRDGAYIAQIDENYVAKPTARCALSIRLEQRKRLYHLRTGILYRYAANGRRGPVWRSAPLPGKAVFLFMEDNLVFAVGKVATTGKDDKFAGFACAYSEFLLPDGRRAGEYCDHDLSVEGIGVPSHIRLQSRSFNVENGELVALRQADKVELNALVDISEFQPGKIMADAARGARRPCANGVRNSSVKPAWTPARMMRKMTRTEVHWPLLVPGSPGWSRDKHCQQGQ